MIQNKEIEKYFSKVKRLMKNFDIFFDYYSGTKLYLSPKNGNKKIVIKKLTTLISNPPENFEWCADCGKRGLYLAYSKSEFKESNRPSHFNYPGGYCRINNEKWESDGYTVVYNEEIECEFGQLESEYDYSIDINMTAISNTAKMYYELFEEIEEQNLNI